MPIPQTFVGRFDFPDQPTACVPGAARRLWRHGVPGADGVLWGCGVGIGVEQDKSVRVDTGLCWGMCGRVLSSGALAIDRLTAGP